VIRSGRLAVAVARVAILVSLILWNLLQHYAKLPVAA